MSALGQKQTCAAHQAMSALPSIATAKEKQTCPKGFLTPESRHVRCVSSCLLLAKIGHEPLFDNLIGAGKYRRRNCEAHCLRGFEIDHQFVLGRCLHW